MTKLSDTQAIILSAAAQRADGNLLPLPGSLRGGAATKVVGALLARGLAREEVTDSPRPAPTAALNTVWRNEDDGRARPAPHHPRRARGDRRRAGRRACGAPAGDAVAYRFNAGTNSAGEPAAGRGGGAGRGAEEARPAEEDGRAHGAGRAPRRARPATTPSRRS